MPTPDSAASRTSDGRLFFLPDLSLSEGFVKDMISNVKLWNGNEHRRFA